MKGLDPKSKFDLADLAPIQRAKAAWIIGLGIFLFGLILVGLLWFKFLIVHDRFLALAPINSILYIHTKNSNWPINSYQMVNLPFNKIYSTVDSTFAWPAGYFQHDVLPQATELAFILLPNQNQSQFDAVLILRINDSAFLDQLSKNV